MGQKAKALDTAERLAKDAQLLVANGRLSSAYMLTISALEEIGKFYLNSLDNKVSQNHQSKLQAAGEVAQFMAVFESVMNDEGKAIAEAMTVDGVKRYTFNDSQALSKLVIEKFHNNPQRLTAILPLLVGIARKRKNAALYEENDEPMPEESEIVQLLGETKYLIDSANRNSFPKELFAKIRSLRDKTEFN